MNLLRIIQSQAIRFLKAMSPSGSNIYGGNLSKAFESRYGFLQGPRTVDDYNIQNGITFLHGWFDQRVVIDKFQIFEDGIIAETTASMEECDAFIDDAIQWAREIGIAIQEPKKPTKVYHSQIEIQADLAIEEVFNNRFTKLCRQITDTLLSYGHEPPDFGVSGILLHGDISKHPIPRAISLSFERRTGQPYESNIYFSAAPFRTSDHLRLLNELEKALLA